MGFGEELEKLVTKEISQLDLSSSSLRQFSSSYGAMITAGTTTGAIDEDNFKEALETAAINQARKDLKYLLKTGNYADHLERTDCLAYAIQKGVLDPEELSKVKFDNGDNVENFPKRYNADTTIRRLIGQVLNCEMNVPELKGSFRDYCC